jgi:hypothetical protein
MPWTKFISTIHLRMENLFLPVTIEEAAIPIFTERVSSEMI